MTTIKERISQLPDLLNIRKSIFFERIGVASSAFRGSGLKNSVSADVVVRITTEYPEVNPMWILYAQGAPLLTAEERTNVKKANTSETDTLMLDFINKQGIEIGYLKAKIEQLEAEISDLKGATGNSYVIGEAVAAG